MTLTLGLATDVVSGNPVLAGVVPHNSVQQQHLLDANNNSHLG